MSGKQCFAAVAVSMCLVAPPVAAQVFSWDPLKDVQDVLPEGTPSESKIIQARQQVREMSQDALATLYEVAPGTRRIVDRAAGYAVFSTFGVKLFFAGGTTGKGVVVNQRTQRQTFMKMVQVQGGLGFGLNQNRLIFIFTNEQALRNFINQGWEFGGQANLSAWPGPGHAIQRRSRSVARRVPLPNNADWPFRNADRRRHEILQGWRSYCYRIRYESNGVSRTTLCWLLGPGVNHDFPTF